MSQKTSSLKKLMTLCENLRKIGYTESRTLTTYEKNKLDFHQNYESYFDKGLGFNEEICREQYLLDKANL